MCNRIISFITALAFSISLFSVVSYAEETVLTCPKCGSELIKNSLNIGVVESYYLVCKNAECENYNMPIYGGMNYDGNPVTGVGQKPVVTVKPAADLPEPPSGYTTPGMPTITNDGKIRLAPSSFSIEGRTRYYNQSRSNWPLAFRKGTWVDETTEAPSGYVATKTSSTDTSASISMTVSSDALSLAVPCVTVYFTFPVNCYSSIDSNSFNPILHVSARCSGSSGYSSLPESDTAFSKISGFSNKYRVAGSEGTCYVYPIVYQDSMNTNGLTFKNLSQVVSANITVDISHCYYIIEPVETSIVTTNNITINNTTYKGNIYTDNSTNLTYIYPDDGAGGVSDTPIIYNTTNNQYVTYDGDTNNYYYITYVTNPDPTPTAAPTPTPDPGGGDFKGGSSAGRRPDEAPEDWTAGYYTLNGYRYRCNYAQKAIQLLGSTPYVTDKTRVATDGIPISVGTYKFTMPDHVQWRAVRWDDTSQTGTYVNSEAWKNTSYYTFDTSEYLIFEFRKDDGSELSIGDVSLTLQNGNIEKPYPDAEITPTPTPTLTPTPTPTATVTPTPTSIPEITPTPTPGGSGGSGGGDGGGSGGAGSPSWDNPLNKLLDRLSSILFDLLGLIWALLKFIIWLVSKMFSFFPFLPPGVGIAVGSTLVICFVLAIIKFIRG